jgi:hypothetical protein|tara:strand:+ start:553 stop:1143 length:591 start_codon:yes stop_codon:yes gene_type:complete
MNQEILDINVQKKFPIPGSSLTADPENPAPFDKPPEFTNVHQCLDFILAQTIEEENYVKFIELMADGFPLMEVVQTITFAGFTEGKWNYSMMLLLIEPVAYILLALCERAGIDPKFFRDEAREDDNETDEMFGAEFDKEKLQQLKSDVKQDNVPHPAIDEQMLAKIDALDSVQTDSLLAPEQDEMAEPSLLRNEGV